MANCGGALILTNGGQMWLHGYAIFSSVSIENTSLAPGYYTYAQLVALSPSNNFSPKGLVGTGALIVQAYSPVFTLPPVVTQNPISLNVAPGESAVFSTTDSGTTPFFYQWTSNGVALTDGGGVTGSGTADLSISSIVASDAASYAVSVSNATGVVAISAPAILTVSPPLADVPANIVQNNDPGVCEAVVNFTLPAQTNSAGLSNVVATPASGSEFPVGTTVVTVVVTDVYGDIATNTFNVTVIDTQPPVITSPGNIVQAVDAGQTYATVTFSLSATDNCGVSNVVATPPSGTQFPVGTNTVTEVATDVNGNSTTNFFTVAVIGLPQIITEPASQTNVNGGTALFTVAATSQAPLAYQWFDNSSPLSDGGRISGSSTATLTIVNLTNTDAASYSVVVSNLNLGGSVTSTPAALTVVVPQIATNYFYYQGNQSASPGTNWFGTGTTGNYWTNTFTGAKTYATAGTVTAFCHQLQLLRVDQQRHSVGQTARPTTLIRPRPIYVADAGSGRPFSREIH